jgi:multiple sugar transport system substrate-binding protein
VKTSQQTLLGQLTPKDMAAQWSDYMSKAQKKHLASSK